MEDEEIVIDDDLFEEQEGLEDNQEENDETETEENDVEESETEEEEEEVEEDEEQEDEVDYKALYEAEQEKRNKLQKALNAERKMKKAPKKEESSIYKQLVASGVDESIAKTLAETSDKSRDELDEVRFELSLSKASKKSGFEDIEEYAEEIRPFVDKGLTVEQAYYVATGEKQKINTKAEIKRQLEAKMKNQKIKNKVQKVDTSGSASVKSSVKPSSLDIKLARAFGMSIEEYQAYKGIESQADYQKLKNKNKK